MRRELMGRGRRGRRRRRRERKRRRAKEDQKVSIMSDILVLG
jgi:hypothetical protein